MKAFWILIFQEVKPTIEKNSETRDNKLAYQIKSQLSSTLTPLDDSNLSAFKKSATLGDKKAIKSSSGIAYFLSADPQESSHLNPHITAIKKYETAEEQQNTAVEEQQTTAVQQPLPAHPQQQTADQQPLTAVQQQQTAEQQTLTADLQPLTANPQPLADYQQPLRADQQPLTAYQQKQKYNQQTLTADQQPLTAYQPQKVADQQQQTSDLQQQTADQQQQTDEQQQQTADPQQQTADQQQPTVNKTKQQLTTEELKRYSAIIKQQLAAKKQQQLTANQQQQRTAEKHIQNNNKITEHDLTHLQQKDITQKAKEFKKDGVLVTQKGEENPLNRDWESTQEAVENVGYKSDWQAANKSQVSMHSSHRLISIVSIFYKNFVMIQKEYFCRKVIKNKKMLDFLKR